MTNPTQITNAIVKPAEPTAKEPATAKPEETKIDPKPKLRLLRPQFEQEERVARKPLALRFSPYAWAKMLFFRDAGDTEIGGFGVTPPDDLLYIEDFVTVKQETTCVSIAFDDAAVGDFFETQVDQGRRPEQFARTWIHSHPGDCPQPSTTDEATFARVFGKCDWAILAILARGGKAYARLRFNVGPGGQVLIPMDVDYTRPFPAADFAAWVAEYKANIHAKPWEHPAERFIHEHPQELADTDTAALEAREEFDAMETGFLGDPDNPWW